MFDNWFHFSNYPDFCIIRAQLIGLPATTLTQLRRITNVVFVLIFSGTFFVRFHPFDGLVQLPLSFYRRFVVFGQDSFFSFFLFFLLSLKIFHPKISVIIDFLCLISNDVFVTQSWKITNILLTSQHSQQSSDWTLQAQVGDEWEITRRKLPTAGAWDFPNTRVSCQINDEENKIFRRFSCHRTTSLVQIYFPDNLFSSGQIFLDSFVLGKWPTLARFHPRVSGSSLPIGNQLRHLTTFC